MKRYEASGVNIMAIEINNISGALFTGSHEQREVTPVNHEPNQEQRETGKPSTGGTVSLTESARQLHQLEDQINAQPVVDAQRIDEARQNIADGNHNINPSTIAQKLALLEEQLPPAA